MHETTASSLSARRHGTRLLALLGATIGAACAGEPAQPTAVRGDTPLASTVALQPVDLSAGQWSLAAVVTETGYVLGGTGQNGVKQISIGAWWSVATAGAPTLMEVGVGETSDNNQGDFVDRSSSFRRATAGGPPWSKEPLQDYPGVTYTWAHAVNDEGVIVGSTSGNVAVRWPSPAAAPEALPTPTVSGATVTSAAAQDINGAGLVVGYANVQRKRQVTAVPIVWTTTGPVVLQDPFGNARAESINESGVIAGRGTSGVTQYALRWTPDAGGNYGAAQVSPLANSTPDWLITKAAIDACGRIVHRDVLWIGASATRLPALAGDDYGSAADIAADGTIVGFSRKNGRNRDIGTQRAVLWRGLGPCP